MMSKQRKTKIMIMLIICILFVAVFGRVNAAQELPVTKERIELKVKEIKEMPNGTSQLIAELWAYDITFSAIQLDLDYDTNKIIPSDADTNGALQNDSEEVIQDGTWFDVVVNYIGKLFSWFIGFDPLTGLIQHQLYAMFTTEEIGSDGTLTVDSDDTSFITADANGTLLGTYTYQYLGGKIDENTIKLKPTEDNPTGILVQVGLDNEKMDYDYYSDPKMFTFIAYSDNCNLEDIKIEDTSITGFDKDTLTYEHEILEEKDNIKIKPIAEDENASIKVEVTKAKEANEEELEYVEIQIDSADKDYEIPLLGLGEVTGVKITVTAEDGTSIKEYTVEIKQACGILKGELLTETSIGKHTATIRVYKKDEIDWSDIENFRDGLTGNLIIQPTWKKELVTEEDGTFNIKLSPGKYDILIDRAGYADWVVKEILITKDTDSDIGLKKLIAGDVNKDGLVEMMDLVEIKNLYLKSVVDDTGFGFPPENYDFNDDEIVEMVELVYVKGNYDANNMKYKIENY